MGTRRVVAVLALLALLAAACGEDAGSGVLVASGLERRPADAPAGHVEAVAASNRAFAADAYRRLAAESGGNLVFSPTSIYLALAMTYTGARGQTAAEMADVLQIELDDDAFHGAMNALDQALGSRNREEVPQADGGRGKVLLSVANALWGQQGLSFGPEFLDTLAAEYGAGMRVVDFVGATEAARRAINAWVAGETNNRIEDLIPEGVLSGMTRLVLTNAVYLDADWWSPFDADDTSKRPFFLLDGSQVEVEMMHQSRSLPYAAGDGWQAVELPYAGRELAMVFLVPDRGRFVEVEALVGGGLFDEALAGLGEARMDLGLPKFEFRFKASVAELLRAMGMPAAFGGGADFSGITTEAALFITDVIHEAFILVDEEGTEAAAATAVVMGETAAAPEDLQLEIDRPFLFWLYDRATGAVLFMGRVMDPTA